MKPQEISIDGKNLTFDILSRVAFAKPGEIKVRVADKAKKRMEKSRKYVSRVSSNQTIYGINTGFGVLANKKIDETDLQKLQLNLVRSHCTGVGRPFSRPIARGIMLLRANCLVSGYSGITSEIVDLLCDFLTLGITPEIPEKGSVGASGDLAPLGHIALALIGEGEVDFEGKIIPASKALQTVGKKPATLGPKDGLALINGTAAMGALGGLAICSAQKLFKMADIAAAMTLEGLLGTTRAYDKKVSSVRPYPGQTAVAKNLLRLLEGSAILKSHQNCNRVQDPYSLRCVPQIHGACKQTLLHAVDIFTVEFNSVTDNPLIFPDDDDIISGGNFHGEPLALAMDYLSMGLAELCNVSERRIEKMMNPAFSDLPSFLTKKAGLHSGLMMAQVTAAALASENKYLCHPASVDTIPTSTDKEDHVSMGLTAGRKLHEVLFNLKQTLAIEILCNSQALDFRHPLKTSTVLQSVHEKIRRSVPFIHDDRPFYKDINRIVELIDSDEILDIVHQHIGELE